jgi:hypothetical protein
MKTQAETIAGLSARCAGPNEFVNFDRAFRTALTVPKAAVLKEDARWKRARANEARQEVQFEGAWSTAFGTALAVELPSVAQRRSLVP